MYSSLLQNTEELQKKLKQKVKQLVANETDIAATKLFTSLSQDKTR
jgi:hypothetical protein